MPYKECPNCKKKLGVRTKMCECKHSFLNSASVQEVSWETKQKKRRRRKNRSWVRVKDWTTLQINDVIVVKGGPYFPSKTGEKISMASKGKFRVKAIDKEGLTCYDINHGGYEYVYCGPEVVSEKTGTIMRPHKIKVFIPDE